ncbi:MAG TPA: hypothetical protein ENL42_02585 [Thermoplasmatales archaeon]|nr:hypothetical protein [Thermoplasmatales archaeon]
MSEWFDKGCKFALKHFSWLVGDIKKFQQKVNERVSKEFMDSLIFTGMDAEPHEIILFSYAGAIIAFIVALVLDILLLAFSGFSLRSIGYLTILLMAIVTIILPILALQIISEYPKTKAKYMKIHSLGDIPEVLSYIVMYLKLIPNLENALRFAARESKTSLAKDLRKLMWDLEVRIHKSIDDAVTYFANMWGKWSDYLKRAMHLVRSSIHERSEGERNVTLDRSLDVVLEGTKSMMIEFANKLHQPTLVIYSMGVMIPLALVAMLPAAAAVGLRLSIFQIFIFYDIILPLLLFIYIRKVLLARPATFNPPAVPSDHPALQKINKKANLIAAISLGSLITIPGIAFMLLRFLPLEGTPLEFFVKPAEEGGINAYFPVTLFILWGIAAAVSLYCLKTYTPYKKIRDDIKEMEKEFADSLYVLGKRIMEGRPAEEAFHYASETLEGSKMGEVFRQTAFNLLSMRMNSNEALFDKKFGSLKHVYSDRIRAIMRLFVEGVKRSYVAAGVAIVKIADHLKQLQDVEKNIRNALGVLTSTLRTTATLFAPIIAGVTLGITKLISNILNTMDLQSITAEIANETENTFFGSMEFYIMDVPPEIFVLVIGIYVIQLVFLLVRFANGIEEGDDKIQFMYSLGKSLPAAIAFFSIVTIFSMIMFQKMSPV